MTSVFYAIGDLASKGFAIMPHILQGGDLFFVIVGTILTIGWIRHMIKNEDDKGWYEVPESNDKH